MSLLRAFLDLTARVLASSADGAGQRSAPARRILVIRRSRMGDMICTLPLLHALRRLEPTAHIAVACDEPGFSIAHACTAVDEVILLHPARNSWIALLRNAARLQGYDWVFAAKGGFDRRLAILSRLTNAARRIGFEAPAAEPSAYFTDRVDLPPEQPREHQIETLLRLLEPLGIASSPEADAFDLRLPDSACDFAARTLANAPFASKRRYVLVNLSSTAPLKFDEAAYRTMLERIVAKTDFAIGIVAAPRDRARAGLLAAKFNANRVASLETPGTLELAALLRHAAFIFTPEGGAAHLAGALGRPALVLWSEGPFDKWHSRGPNHAFVLADPGENAIGVEQVWSALLPFLALPEDEGEQARTGAATAPAPSRLAG